MAGAALTLIGGRFIQPALFRKSEYDPLVFGSVALVTVLATPLASLVPAGRAVRDDPSIALRVE